LQSELSEDEGSYYESVPTSAAASRGNAADLDGDSSGWETDTEADADVVSCACTCKIQA